MQVVGIVPAYPPGSLVGAFLATHRLLVRLVERGHKVDVISQIGAAYELDGVSVHRLDADAEQRVAACDVVISHLGDDDRAAQAAQFYAKPIVRMVHGPVDSGRRKLYRYAWPDLVVFNSESMARSYEWSRPSVVVHPFTDPADYRTRTGGMVTLVNLSEAKGGRLFDRLARSMPDRQFLGVKGGYGNQVFPQHRNVTVIPNTDRMRDDVYARTRVLLMPSDRETWGMVGIEAMSAGIPVIAHPTPGLLESLGHAGIFVDRGDAHGWSDAIRRLDDPSEYELASKRALARVDELEPVLRAGGDRFADAVEALIGGS